MDSGSLYKITSLTRHNCSDMHNFFDKIHNYQMQVVEVFVATLG